MKTILFVAICLLTGCLARPHLDKQSFIFAHSPLAAPRATSSNRVLGIRTLQVDEPFQGRSFVYRTGEFSYDRDPYAEFMDSPADGLVQPVCSYFRDSGGFLSVVESGSALKPNTVAEIQVVELYGDFRPAEHPAAVLAIRFAFFDAPGGIVGKVILQREYSRNIPLKARTAPALIEGWNQALAQILDSAMQDFRQADESPPKP